MYFGDRYSCGRKVRRVFARKLRLALHLFRGRWFTLIPFQTPITVVIGIPIEVGEPIPDPTEKQINNLHAKYCEAIRLLYNAHRKTYGYDGVELQIL